jgi:hypothetical protein
VALGPTPVHPLSVRARLVLAALLAACHPAPTPPAAPPVVGERGSCAGVCARHAACLAQPSPSPVCLARCELADPSPAELAGLERAGCAELHRLLVPAERPAQRGCPPVPAAIPDGTCPAGQP